MQNQRPSEDQTRARAYTLYLTRGCQHGQDTNDWQQAEYELRQLPSRQIAERQPPKSKRDQLSGS